VGSRAAATSSARNPIFCARRRFYDRIVLVETEHHRFAVKHLLSDMLLNESGQFLGIRLSSATISRAHG
jgi:hypothetical protein